MKVFVPVSDEIFNKVDRQLNLSLENESLVPFSVDMLIVKDDGGPHYQPSNWVSSSTYGEARRRLTNCASAC